MHDDAINHWDAANETVEEATQRISDLISAALCKNSDYSKNIYKKYRLKNKYRDTLSKEQIDTLINL